VRVRNDAYGLVALVLDDKLGAGLKHSGQASHLYGRIARTGPHHSSVDVGDEHFVGTCG
jgi:hypothetical protein